MITFKGIELETNDISFRPTLITEEAHLNNRSLCQSC